MAKKPMKLGRGRPTKEIAQQLAMMEAQSIVKEKMIEAYPEAGEYIIKVMKGQLPSTPQARMAAAKTIKDLVETWLTSAAKEDGAEEEDEQDLTPRVMDIG